MCVLPFPTRYVSWPLSVSEFSCFPLPAVYDFVTWWMYGVHLGCVQDCCVFALEVDILSSPRGVAGFRIVPRVWCLIHIKVWYSRDLFVYTWDAEASSVPRVCFTTYIPAELGHIIQQNILCQIWSGPGVNLIDWSTVPLKPSIESSILLLPYHTQVKELMQANYLQGLNCQLKMKTATV